MTCSDFQKTEQTQKSVGSTPDINELWQLIDVTVNF